MFKELDPLLHSQVRLAIMSILIGVKNAEFAYLLEHINTTKGNLSFQINKLKEAGYIEVTKSFKGNYPLTTCQISDKGVDAYEKYVNAIDEYFKQYKNNEN
ncbi:MAG: transcriptional regulator [Bacteroidales bacterium]|nr:transcriptional regulator [Bacteroidales bacterium]